MRRVIYRDVAELAADLQQACGDGSVDVQRGQLDGLLRRGRVPLRRGDAEGTDTYRAGFLAGALYRHLLETRGSLDERSMLAAGVYGASIAQAAAQDRFDRPAADDVIKEHTAACIRIARRGLVAGAEEERAFFDWLAGALDVRIRASDEARYERLRQRRLAALASDDPATQGRGAPN